MNRVLAGVAAVLTPLLLVLVAPGESASADPQPVTAALAERVIVVHGGAGGVTINRHVVSAGRVVFRVHTSNAQSGSIVLLLRPAVHVRRAMLSTDFGEEGSNDRLVAAKERGI